MVTAGVIAALLTAIAIAIRQILFAIGKGLCWIVGFLSEVFDMVAGLKNITYQGTTRMPLIKVFFTNSNINTIFWGMALIGIVMCIAFAIVAVIKKSGDIGDKMKQSMGDIIRNCFKGIALILLMNFIMSSTISITTTLMDRINYLIVNAQNFDLSYDVTFSSKDYAAMGRCLNTIGNYSLNASYNSRYNLNSCYNSIRTDLKQLGDDGKFDDTYITTVHENDTTRTVNTWQSVLQNIYRSVEDISVQQPLDEYNTKLADAMLEAMEIIRNDASFEALEKYHVDQSSKTVGEKVQLDRMIMLLGSMYGTGEEFTRGAGFTDYIRGPYYYGQKDIFSFNQVKKDFDMNVGTWLYLTVIIVAFLFVKEMLAMVFNASARIFNMLLLYITAPPFIAVTPLDDGGKLKQWTTAFIIQSLGLFGSVISLKLVMLFIPVIFSGDIQFFENVRMDTFTRVIIMYGAIFTSRKASGMIVGILADNAGWQAISAGDVGSEARGAIDTGIGLGKAIGGYGIGLAKAGLGKADAAIEKKKEKDKDKKDGDKKDGDKKGGGTPQNMLDIGSKTNANRQSLPAAGANVAAGAANNVGKLGSGAAEKGSNPPENKGNAGAGGNGNAAAAQNNPPNNGNAGAAGDNGNAAGQNNPLPPNNGNAGAAGDNQNAPAGQSNPQANNGNAGAGDNQNAPAGQNNPQANNANAGTGDNPNAAAAQNREPANQLGNGRFAAGGSKTFEDAEISERKNRSIPDSFKDAF